MESTPTGATDLRTTLEQRPPRGSALDPLVEEATWAAYRVTAADPARTMRGSLEAVASGFGRLVEIAWRPGRSALFTEVTFDPANDASDASLRCHIAAGAFGPCGTTHAEAAALARELAALCDREDGSLSADPVDPAAVLGSGGRFSALLRQPTICIDAEGVDVEVVSRFNATRAPWGPVCRTLAVSGQAVTVRATVLATELSPLDRQELDHGVSRVDTARRVASTYQLERAWATLVDLQACFASPLLIAEIAVTSPDPLSETLLRAIGSAFTSEFELIRREGHTLVAAQRLQVGGFEIERDPPGLPAALAAGVPLRGGLEPRDLRDLVTLAESPIGCPLAVGQALPGLPSDTTPGSPVTPALRPAPGGASTTLGRTSRGSEDVALPIRLRTQHTFIAGVWGSGKSTALTRLALDDLREGRAFLFLDPHGGAADWLRSWANHLGRGVLTIDPEDGATSRLRPFPKLRLDGRNEEEVTRAIAQLSDAVARSLLNSEWAGPRWSSAMRAMLEVGAAHGAALIDIVTWLNDTNQLEQRIKHPAVSALSSSTLSNITGSYGDAQAMRSWVSSKLHVLVSGSARRIFDRAGRGVELSAAVEAGTPIIVNLGSLSHQEAGLIGHLILERVLDAAMAREMDDRTLLTCYVDEVHRFPVRGLTRVLAEGRKFGVGIVGATQAVSQLPNELADLALGASTTLAFRSSPDTAALIGARARIDPEQLTRLPDLRCALSVTGLPTTFVDLPPYETCPTPYVKTPPARLNRSGRQRRQGAKRFPSPRSEPADPFTVS